MEDLSLWRWYYNGHSSPSDVIARRDPWDNTLDSINKDLTFFCSFHKERNFPTLLYQWNHFSFFTLVTMKLLLLLLLGLFLCVQMHVCKCACVYVSMCIGSPEAACYPKLHHSLVFETVCHWTWSPRLQLGWPASELQRPTHLYLPNAAIADMLWAYNFSVDARDRNSDPGAYAAGPLWIESSPWLRILLFPSLNLW